MADPSDARCDRQRGTMTADRQAVRPSKVPQIIALFWAVKLATTAMGESTSDYLVKRFDPVAAVCVAAVILLMALILQFKATRYVAWRYWFAVVMVAVFGTMAADVLHIQFHIPYVATTTFFRHRAGGGLCRVASSRGHAVHPQHYDDATRALLLGHRHGDVRIGNRPR